MHFTFKNFLPHILILLGFIVLSVAYFNPVVSGKAIFQNDIKNYIGMAKQQTDYRTTTGEETYWTNSAFGGMPTYQLGAKYPHNYIKSLDLTLRFLPRPVDYLFLYFVGFYVLLLVLKVDYKLAGLGALAFGFSTYLIIILGVGHNSKAHAIAYMPFVLSGILLVFQKRYLPGFLVSVLALGLEICANHYQMTYYLMLLVLVLGIVYLIDAFKKGEQVHFFKSVGILLVALFLAIGLNATNVMATQEYVKESTRGKSELTITPDGSPKNITHGLDKSYITEYSYGILETLNLFIPRFMGGGNAEDVGKNSALYSFYVNRGVPSLQAQRLTKQAPTYWGNQPIVEAPAYVGAVVIFLFVMALFLVKGRLKWWLLATILMSWLLSLGKNWFFVTHPSPDSNPITNFFINYFPLYNKFRAVSSVQVLLELCIPILGIFALVRVFNSFEKEEVKWKALKMTTGITAGLVLLLLLFKNVLFDFAGINDAYFRQNYGLEFVNALQEDRKAMFTVDSLRTLVLVLLTAAVLYGYLKKKFSRNITICGLGVLLLFDLIGVDRRYVNNDDFKPAIEVNKPFQATQVDQEIQKDTTYFRVFDISTEGSANPGRAPYFHNSINGYHAAKLQRFNDLNTFYITDLKPEILNMLNVKYIIAEDEEGKLFPYFNEEANGNAWFVKQLKQVGSADEEILALDSLDTKETAVIHNPKNAYASSYTLDSTATIQAVIYKPNYIKYQTNNKYDGFAVFSEMYYSNGWKVTLDGKETSFVRVNYALRGMEVPKGTHVIEFVFDPEVVKKGSTISLASSILTGFLLILVLFLEIKKRKKK